MITMNDNYVTEQICSVQCKRLEDEDKRQNERIKQLESSIGEIHRLTLSTEKLATSMEQMLVEQKAQGLRISKLEGRDGEKWRDTVKTVVTVVVSAIIGAVLMMVGLQ